MEFLVFLVLGLLYGLGHSQRVDCRHSKIGQNVDVLNEFNDTTACTDAVNGCIRMTINSRIAGVDSQSRNQKQLA